MAAKGFTLIETFLGLALAVFLMAGTSQLMIRAAHLKKKSDGLTASAALAASKLEGLRALPFDSHDLAEGDYQEEVKDSGTGRPFQVMWTIEEVDGQVKRVTVLAKPARTSERGTELSLTLSRPLGF